MPLLGPACHQAGGCRLSHCHAALPASPRPLRLPQVTLAGGEGQPAKVVGYDEDKDVAVLQIDPKDMVSEAPVTLALVSDTRGGAAN